MRGIFVFVLLFLYMRKNKIPFVTNNPKANLMLMLRGALALLALNFNVYAMQKLPLSEVNLIQQLTPTVIGILAWLLLKEPYQKIDIISGLLCFFGVIIVISPS